MRIPEYGIMKNNVIKNIERRSALCGMKYENHRPQLNTIFGSNTATKLNLKGLFFQVTRSVQVTHYGRHDIFSNNLINLKRMFESFT